MKLERIEPRIITIRLTQEESDPDYGSCLWAVFKLDLDRYEISITGDCGNYSYGWHPTPKTESFLHLIGRMDEGYFLDKIANRSRIDQQETYNSVLQLLECNGIAIDAIDEDDCDALLAACGSYDTDSHGVLSEIRDVLEEMEVSKQVDTFDLCGCIEMDYTPSQKKIAEVFGKYIRPWARREDRERAQEPYTLAPIEDYDGLKRKYVVLKSDTGAVVENCFVLRPEKDHAAIEALIAYANSTGNKVLAKDIRAWIDDLSGGR